MAGRHLAVPTAGAPCWSVARGGAGAGRREDRGGRRGHVLRRVGVGRRRAAELEADLLRDEHEMIIGSRVSSGVLYKYAKLVSSASKGCVTDEF